MVVSQGQFFDDADDTQRRLERALENRVGPSHRNDPSTSRRAALGNMPRSGTQRARVLTALLAAGDGATDFELGKTLGILRTAAGTRRHELAEQGLVTATERERETDTPGSMAQVHVLTAAGCEVARRLAKDPT